MVPTVRDLSRELVERLAPAELPTFDVVAEPYLTDPRRAERRLRDHDDPMGFGLGDALAMVTPVVALVSGSVVAAVSDALADSVRATGAKVLRRVTGKKPKELPEPDLSAEKLAEIRELAFKRAVDLGMEHGRAEALADAVVGALVRRR